MTFLAQCAGLGNISWEQFREVIETVESAKKGLERAIGDTIEPIDEQRAQGVVALAARLLVLLRSVSPRSIPAI